MRRNLKQTNEFLIVSWTQRDMRKGKGKNKRRFV